MLFDTLVIVVGGASRIKTLCDASLQFWSHLQIFAFDQAKWVYSAAPIEVVPNALIFTAWCGSCVIIVGTDNAVDHNSLFFGEL